MSGVRLRFRRLRHCNEMRDRDSTLAAGRLFLFCSSSFSSSRQPISRPCPSAAVFLTLGHAAKLHSERQKWVRGDDIGCAARVAAGPQALDTEVNTSLAGATGCAWVVVLLHATTCLAEMPMTQAVDFGCLVVAAGLGHAEIWFWDLPEVYLEGETGCIAKAGLGHEATFCGPLPTIHPAADFGCVVE